VKEFLRLILFKVFRLNPTQQHHYTCTALKGLRVRPLHAECQHCISLTSAFVQLTMTIFFVPLNLSHVIFSPTEDSSLTQTRTMLLFHGILDLVPPLCLIFLLCILPSYLLFKIVYFFIRSMFSENVAGKVVLITGASSGIGEVLT
jgi:glucan phosphoethanolaminetransferase (alkaline phosphatase superfamily)